MVVTDNFNRADAANLGANWTDPGGNWSIVSNQASGPGSGDQDNYAIWTANVFANDQYSQATLKSTGSVGVTVRASGTGAGKQWYALRLLDATQAVIELVSNATGRSLLTTITHAFAVNDVIKLDAASTTLTAYLNGAQVGQVTNAALASGSAGIMIFSAPTQTLDDWEGGDGVTKGYLLCR